MQYYVLRSILASQKKLNELQAATESFFLSSKRYPHYIEPRFSRIEFPNEKPAILLIVGLRASGKTATAHALSSDTGLPILDLAKHRAVGDKTLTGILTRAYSIDKIEAVLEGLRNGTHGIIIDGIEEGRSKTNEQCFQGFLDDVNECTKGASNPAIVIFGGSQVLLPTWFFLRDKGADVGIMQIDPFDLQQAKRYLDSRVIERSTGKHGSYEQALDRSLSKSRASSSMGTANAERAFYSLGFPQALDAIARLFQRERDDDRVTRTLGNGSEEQLDGELLIRISDYLLDLHHNEKVSPDFIEKLAVETGEKLGPWIGSSLYHYEEQCARLLARALGRGFPRQVLENPILNSAYERALLTWLPDHPFLDDDCLRNDVFTAYSVSRCALSAVPEYQALAHDYVKWNRPTYHLLSIFAELAKGRDISVRSFNVLMQSCFELLVVSSNITVKVDGESWETPDLPNESRVHLGITLEFPGETKPRSFAFQGVLDTEVIPLGPYLVNTHVTLPCQVDFSGRPAIEIIGDCAVSARTVRIGTGDLILRDAHPMAGSNTGASSLLLKAEKADGHANELFLGNGTLEIQCAEHGFDYPLAKYVRHIALPFNPEVREKQRKFRKMLTQLTTAARDSSQLVNEYMPRAQSFVSKLGMLEFCLQSIGADQNGLLCEFGVATGDTINFLASRTDQIIHGFDSFEGLPEHWREGYGKGAFKQDTVPEVRGNVCLHQGLFQETLPEWKKKHQGPILFMHVDSDLYSSAKTVFELLADRIVSGTVLQFDEYFNFPGWQEHEHKAFMEFVAANKVKFEYIGYVSNNEQVAVRITEILRPTGMPCVPDSA